MSDGDHGHDHVDDQGHDHGAPEGSAAPKGGPHAPIKHELSYRAKQVYAIERLLVEKGVITREEVQRQVDDTDRPGNGPRIVARAWTDLDFKQRLLEDPKSAVEEIGISATALAGFVVLENTEQTRNLVVCTLCSCYPRPILGMPPDWYKSFNYRSRAVVDPRGVMAEFGTDVPADAEVRVFDSTADIRYMVLPLRPEGTEHLSEEELAKLVTRDSMIGVSNPQFA